MFLGKLNDYREIVGEETLQKIRDAASGLAGKKILHISATSIGGGVAEILSSLVILLKDLDIKASWEVIKGSPGFFDVTKSFHNAMQGGPLELTEQVKATYLDQLKWNSMMQYFEGQDLVINHDPQPLALIDFHKKAQPWVWRCHIDITNPHPGLWAFLAPFIKKHDGIIVSMESYRKPELGLEHFIIPPSINPLLEKNRELPGPEAEKLLSGAGIDTARPLVAQVSRFDKWKDPLGVVRAFKLLKEKVPDAQLALVGEFASDDPEGKVMYEKVKKEAEGIPDTHLITNAPALLVNAIQGRSAAIIQNSTREGFGMTVTEALWKGTPVVARPSGGIPLQVLDGKTGFLVNTEEELAKRCEELIKNPGLREELGSQAKEHVRKNFLITRHLQDYINLANRFLKT